MLRLTYRHVLDYNVDDTYPNSEELPLFKLDIWPAGESNKNSPTLLLIKWSNILLKQSSYECFCDKGNRVLLLARHVRYQRDMVEVLEQSRGEKVMAGDQTQIYWDA